MPRSPFWKDIPFLVGLGMVLTGAAAMIASLLRPAPPSDLDGFHGAALGMTESELRMRFEGAGAGEWREVGEPDLETETIAWRRTAATASLPDEVFFELHGGALMVVRATLAAADPLAQGPPVETSYTAVAAREPEPGGAVRFRLISRTCSEHASEIAALLAARAEGAAAPAASDAGR